MITDPAWFYSSLAQASAAIVGLMGAVLMTRVMDHLGQVRADHRELTNEIRAVYSAINDFILELQELNRFFEEDVALDKKLISQGVQKRQMSHDRDFGSSRGGHIEVNVKERLVDMEKRLAAAVILVPAYPTLKGRITPEGIEAYVQRIQSVSTRADLYAQARNIAVSHENLLIRLSEKLPAFTGKLIPKSFVVIILVLLLLTIFGVLWPLSALPGLDDLAFSKFAMLFGFAFSLLGFFGYLIFQLIEIWRFGLISWPGVTSK